MNITINDEEKFKEYDKIIQATLVNIYTLSKDTKKIILSNFEYDNENHLYFLEVARIASQIFNIPLYINTSWLSFLRIRFNKKYSEIKRENWQFGIDVNEILNYMVTEFNVEKNIYSKIYESYYKRSIK